jgi:hypothetical protein
MGNKRIGAAIRVAVSVVAIVFGGMSCSGKGASGPEVILGSIQTGGHKVEFYIDYGYDSAVLGFALRDPGKHPRYFPIYGSTYRGLEPVTLNVYLSDTEEEMWVHSSWNGWGILAYYRLGDDYCISPHYNEIPASDTPRPESLGGRSRDFPPMDSAHVKKVLTLVHP